MAAKLVDLLTRLATGRLVVVFLLLIMAINAFVLPAIYPPATLYVQSSYSPEKADQLILIAIGLMGWLGKTAYARIRRGTGEISHEK